MNTSLLQAPVQLLVSRPHWLLAGHLFILHVLAAGGWQSATMRLSMLVAVGLLLLWQPFVEGERPIGWRQTVLLFVVVLALVQWLNPWWLLVWCGALAAVIGGRVLWAGVRRERIGYLLAFGDVFGLVILVIVPALAPTAVVLDPGVREWLVRLLWLLPPALLLFPVRTPRRRAGDAFDFFYAVLVFLLLAVFVFGSLSFMLIARTGYLEAVVATSLTLAGALLLLAWAWNPRAGFAGIGSVFARYLLSVGMPLEQWLEVLNEESEREDEPGRFLQASMVRLLPLPWVSGAAWTLAGQSGSCGEPSPVEYGWERDGVGLRLFFSHAPSPAMRWHFEWLLRLAAEVALVKRQAIELQRIGYLQAVYETGARVTHDVKNLLQSLQSLCYAAAQPGDPQALAALLGRQLPLIAERLKATLDKLQNPRPWSATSVPASEWWEALQKRYAGAGILWSAEMPAEGDLPRELFDSVAENLLQNALYKRQHSGNLDVAAHFAISADGPVLAVEDGGSAVPQGQVGRLLSEPVASAQGLGIGLYHAARMAAGMGFRLRLTENRDGAVRFDLAPAEAVMDAARKP